MGCTEWTLDSTEGVTRFTVTPTADNIDFILLESVELKFIGWRGKPLLQAEVELQYGLDDPLFVGIREEAHLLAEASAQAILSTVTASGNIGSNLQAAVFAELLALGLIPAGVLT